MGFVVITGRSILWVFLSLIATLCMLTAVLSAHWIIGPHRMQGNARYEFDYVRPDYTRYRNTPGQIAGVGPFEYDNTPGMYPSIGIYNKCSVINGYNICSSFAAQGIFTNSSTFPTMWKMSLVIYIIGLIILGVSLLGSLLSFCNQTMFDKNIFSLSGSAQVVAGVLFILAILSYASGFGATRMQSFCGPDAGFFSIGDCTFGWAFYTSLVGLILTFVSSFISLYLIHATTKDTNLKQVDMDKSQKGETIV
uniref:Lipoma HMGIC fusion partner-like 2 protein n=1 Tax=Cacopsylla melanoneura TaxID=428564 RepID=A0A8D9AEN0_9HEMI